VALACLVVAGVGAAVMATADGLKLAAAVTRADEAPIAETTPATSLAPFATVVTRLPIVAGAQTTAGKSSCVGSTARVCDPHLRYLNHVHASKDARVQSWR
jgi:hypothetical protein